MPNHPYVLLFLLPLGVLAILPLFPSFLALRRAERAVIRFANRPVAPVVVLFLGVIGIRLALLPKLGIPIPGIHDEFSYLMMADTFTHGRLANPTHPLWVSFETMHVNSVPTYSSIYPPAQGLVLAIGLLLGHPWIGVLLSNAAMCVSIVWMLRAWVPRRWAWLGGVIAALQFSIATYWMNSYWGGAVAAMGGALVLGAMPRVARNANTRDALLLSLGIAILANSRPWEGFVFCIPLAAYLFWWISGKVQAKLDRRARFRRVFLPVLGSLLLTALFMAYYNYRLTGNPLLLPHVWNANTYITGPIFLWQHARAPLHYRNAVFDAFYNADWIRPFNHLTWKDFIALSKIKIAVMGPFYSERTEWPLLLMLPFLFTDRKMRFLLTILLVGTLGVLTSVFAAPHYAAPMLCAVIALLVQAMRHMNTVEIGGRRVGSMTVRIVMVLLAIQIGRSTSEGRCDKVEWMCEGQFDRAVAESQLLAKPGKHLVMVRHRPGHMPEREWVFNGADIDSAKIVWARELDTEQNEKLLAYFKNRQVWLATPDEDDLPLRLPQAYPSAQRDPNIGK